MSMNLDILSLARGLSGHAAARQAVVAENVANADTPGYKAKDIPPFSEVFDTDAPADFALRTTRPGHLSSVEEAPRFDVIEDSAFAAESPNGNTVSIEDQMFRAVETQQAHDMALGVYRKSLDILRSSMGRT